MQLLWTVVTCLLKNVENGTEHDIDSAYGVCMYQTFLNFTTGFMNTLQFKQMMNLAVCQFVILKGFSLAVYGEANFLLKHGGSPEYWEELELK